MVIRRLFGRKKKEDEAEEAEPEAVTEEAEPETPAVEEARAVEEAPPPEEPVEAPPVEEEAAAEEAIEEAVPEPTGYIPYHDSFPDRLKYMFSAEMSVGIEGPDEFRLEFMAMGERFHVAKPANGEIEIKTGTVPNEDVFIRIGDDVVRELLSAATFSEFSDVYLKYYRHPEPGKFVKIELRKDISNLNRRGYARVPLLRLLIGTAR